MNPEFRQSPFDENEIAKFQSLFNIAPERLARRLPTWIKSHMRSIAPPKQFVFVPNAPPVYPNYFTTRKPIVMSIPYYYDGKSAKDYIESFERQNNLTPCEYDYANPA